MTPPLPPRRTPPRRSAKRKTTEPAENETPDATSQELIALGVDPETAERFRRLPKDVGWLLFTAGVMGILVPGVIGTPFLVLGSLMIWPWGQKKAEHWLSGGSPRILKGSMRQVNRFLDDLERRYPRS